MGSPESGRPAGPAELWLESDIVPTECLQIQAQLRGHAIKRPGELYSTAVRRTAQLGGDLFPRLTHRAHLRQVAFLFAQPLLHLAEHFLAGDDLAWSRVTARGI